MNISLTVPFDAGDVDRIERAADVADFDTPEAFIREATLRLVDETIDEDGYLECPFDDCEDTFATIRQRRGHLGNVHADVFPDGDYWCGYCGYGPTGWRAVNSHHSQRHSEDGNPVRLDHEPADGELIAPDDVPDHMDEALLAELYEEYDGVITEMCRGYDFDVTKGRIRHYLIEFGIHEPKPQGEGDDAPLYRQRDWMKERYEAAGGNLSEMHRQLEIDIPYRTLVKNIKRFDFHDPSDPPGKRHGKGGPPPAAQQRDEGEGFVTRCPGCGHEWEYTGGKEPGDETGCPRCSRGSVEIGNTDPDPVDESVEPGVDLPDGEQVFVLEWGRWGPPQGGTYHLTDDCWSMDRSDSDRDVVPLPWPQSELEADDDWDVCGHCTRAASAGAEEIGSLDADDPEDLLRAYEEAASVKAAAEAFPDVSYATVRQRLIDHGIYTPDSYASATVRDLADDDDEDDEDGEPEPAPAEEPPLSMDDLGIDVDDPWETEEQENYGGDDRIVEAEVDD